MSIEVVVYEDGKEVARQDLKAVGYVVVTDEEVWKVSSLQKWPQSGTVQMTIKRAAPSSEEGQ